MALASRSRPLRSALLAAFLFTNLGREGQPNAGACRLLRYTFQVASRPPDAVAAGTLELPPQIAVWLETADGGYVDTLMVTTGVALRGLGNRPGQFDLPSGPKFPYGRRPMALPVWAHAHGRLYPSVVMEDGNETELGMHEDTSSLEPYFCRPMLDSEVVDAITCPSGNFRSAKGVFAPDGSTSYYPPRGDLLTVLGQPCPPEVNHRGGSCDDGDSPQFGLLDDVDAVATATPAADVTTSGTWTIPQNLAASDYAVLIEVGKEFDANASYSFPSAEGPVDVARNMEVGVYGQRHNLGQPSVVYRVPVSLTIGASSASTASIGHGDALGAVGTLSSDTTLSNAPGSGEGRLAVIAGPSGLGRVHVEVDACPTATCDLAGVPRPVEADVQQSDVTPTSAVVEIQQEAAGTEALLGYDTRYRLLGSNEAVDPTEIPRWAPGPTVPVGPAGTVSRTTLSDLAPDADYVVAARALGACGTSTPTIVRFATPKMKFAQLSGCFIASAAFDDETVDALRRLRDRATRASGLAAAGAALYYRSSPPLADLIRKSETARAIVRKALGPLVTLARAAETTAF
jgi:hypothetical protein